MMRVLIWIWTAWLFAICTYQVCLFAYMMVTQ